MGLYYGAMYIHVHMYVTMVTMYIYMYVTMVTMYYLCCFSLPCPSRSSWGSSKLEVEGSSEGEVAPVCERGDHQSACVAQVLIAVDKLGVHCSHQHLIVPVVPEGRDSGPSPTSQPPQTSGGWIVAVSRS